MNAAIAKARSLVRRHDLLALSYLTVLALIFLFEKASIYRTLFYLAVLPCFALTFDREALRAVMRSWVWRAVALLLAYLWLTLLWAETVRPVDYYNFARRAIMIVLFVTITAHLVATHPGFVRRLFRVLVPVAAAAAAVSIGWALWEGQKFPYFRIGGLGIWNPNPAAAVYCTMIVGAAFHLFRQGDSRRSSLLYAGLLCVLIVFVLLTQSRGNLLALTVTGCALGVLVSARWTLAALALGAVAAVVLQLAGLFDFNLLLARGTSLRLEAWQIGSDLWQRQPLFGLGVNYFVEVATSNADTIWHAHNIYLSYLLHGGIVGLALFLFMCAASGLAAWQAYTRTGNPGLLGMLLFIMLYGNVDLTIFIENASWQWLHFWLPFGLIAGADAAARLSASAGDGRIAPLPVPE